MSNSSFEEDIERVNSEEIRAFDAVPGDILFTFKLKDKFGKTVGKAFGYELKKGKILPYTTLIKGEFA